MASPDDLRDRIETAIRRPSWEEVDAIIEDQVRNVMAEVEPILAERDEARAEVERLRAERDEALRLNEAMRFDVGDLRASLAHAIGVFERLYPAPRAGEQHG